LKRFTWQGLPAGHADMNEELLVSTCDQQVLIMSQTAGKAFFGCTIDSNDGRCVQLAGT